MLAIKEHKKNIVKCFVYINGLLLFIHYKGGGLETTRLRADLPFSYTSFDANVLNIFFSERKMDEESNISCFIFFEALLN